MTEVTAIEKRRHVRLAPTIIRAAVEDANGLRQGYLMNVSLGGAFLVLEEPPPPEQTSELVILLPWGMGECRVKARSVWQQRDDENRPIGAGLSFIDLEEPTKERLRAYLDRFADLATQMTD